MPLSLARKAQERRGGVFMGYLLRMGIVTLLLALGANHLVSEVINPAGAGLVLQIDQLAEVQIRQ